MISSNNSFMTLIFDEDYRLLLHGILAALLAILAFPTLVWIREQVIVLRTPQPPKIDWDTKLSTSSNSSTGESEIIDTVHLIVLVHGLQNTPWSLKGLKASLESQAEGAVAAAAASNNNGTGGRGNGKSVVVVHSSNSCVGKTTKGIMMCGRLLAQEINDILSSLMVHVEQQQQQQQGAGGATRPTTIRKVTLSLYGNSLGGLMARASLPHIQWNYHVNNDTTTTSSASFYSPSQQQPHRNHNKIKITIQPNIFCTTSSPHLGSRGSLIFYLPNWFQYAVALVYGKSMQDLLRITNAMEVLQSDTYLRVLGGFNKRISYTTSYQVDFQVPTMTAAFLTQTKSLHRVLSEFTTSPNNTGSGRPIPFLIQAYSTHKTTTSLTASTSSSSSDGGSSFDHDEEDEDTTYNDEIDYYSNNSTKKSPLLVSSLEEEEEEQATASCPSSSLLMSDQDWIDYHGSRLDRLGWIKVFCDFRPKLFSIPTSPFCFGGGASAADTTNQEVSSPSSSTTSSSCCSSNNSPWITSLQLRKQYCTPTIGRWYAPLAHTVVTGMLAGFWSNDTIIHALAERLLHDVLEEEEEEESLLLYQPQEES